MVRRRLFETWWGEVVLSVFEEVTGLAVVDAVALGETRAPGPKAERLVGAADTSWGERQLQGEDCTVKLEMLQIPECIENWFDDQRYQLVKSSDGNPDQKLSEAYRALGEHLADDEVGRRLFGELDEAVSAMLVACEQAGYSIGYTLGRWPEKVLAPEGAG